MKILDSVLDAIGNTPMVRLNRLPGDDCAEVVVKLEYFSPSGSVKDRSAWGIIRDAEQKNLLGPDSIIVRLAAATRNRPGHDRSSQGIQSWCLCLSQ